MLMQRSLWGFQAPFIGFKEWFPALARKCSLGRDDTSPKHRHAAALIGA